MKVNILSPVFVCKGCRFSSREAPASSSEGEEKKPGQSASAAENMPEMSADSKFLFHTVILTITFNGVMPWLSKAGQYYPLDKSFSSG